MQVESKFISIKRKTLLHIVVAVLILGIVTPVLADYLGPDRTTTTSEVDTYDYGVWARDNNKVPYCLDKKGNKADDCIVCEWKRKPGNACGDATYSYTLGTRSEVVETTVNLPPATISSSLQNCNLNNGWCNTASELSLNGTEPLSGYNILAIEGSLNGQTFACSGSNCNVPLNEGNNDLSFWALSSYGDSSTMGTTSAKVDTVSPAPGLDITATSGTNGWYVSPATITATGSDSTSGLSSVFLSIDGGIWVSSTTLNEGIYNVSVQAEDNAGNIAQSPTTISIDATTPTLDVSINGTMASNGWYSSSMEVIAVAGDATSGVASLESSLDGGVYQVYNAPVAFADGYHTVQFKAVDKAGNDTETSVQEFYVDTVVPAIDLPPEWEVNDTITYKVQDEGSGLSALRIVIEDEDEKFAKVAWNEVVSGNKFKGEITWNGKFKDGTVAPPGEYLVWVKATDVAGNERIGLGRVIVPSLFSLFPSTKSSSEILIPPADLFDSKDSFPLPANPNPDTSTPPSTSFGGSTSQTNSTTVQSLTLTSDSSSASSTTPSNVLWGATAASMLGAATAYALEERRKRKEAEARRQKESAARKEASHRANRDEEPPMTRQDAQARKQRKELRKIWDANGAAIYEANREYKAKHGKEIDAAARSKAIKDATMNGIFNAGAYASNLEAEKARQDAQNERMANKMTRIEKEEEVRWQASQKAAEEKQKAEELQAGYAAYYAATRQGEQEAQTSSWDKAIDFVQKKIAPPLTKIVQVVSNPSQSFANLQSTQGGGKLAMPVHYDDPPNWFEVQLSKIRNHLFSSGNEPPTAFDRIVSTLDNFPVIELNGWSDWSDSRKELLTSISDAQDDNQYHYDDHYLELGAWNSSVSVNQLNTLQTYVENGKVSFEDTLANIETLQVYKDYDNAEMVTALREIYYAGALDPFILGAQNYNSSAFNVFGSGNRISQGDAQFALAAMMLTTQGEDYAPPIVKIQHPQGYSTDGEFGLDHIIAALDAKFHESTEGYIFSDGVDNEVRPPWFGFIGTNPISGELESVKNRIASFAFWRLDLDPKTIQSIPAVTWQGDLAGSTAMAYQNGDAEKGYNIEMPLADFESDILGVVLTSNNAIDPNGTNLAQELSTALADDSPYVTRKYQKIAKLLNIQYVPQTGEIQPESAQEFLINNLEMVSDLGTGFYANGNMLSGLKLVFSSSEQSIIHAYAEAQINRFLQQIQDGIQEEVGR